MIVDAHNHPDWHGHDFPKFLADMDANGIDVTWLLSWETPEGEWNPEDRAFLPEAPDRGPVAFGRCVSYAERAPSRFVLGFAPDPRKADAIDRLKAAKAIWGVRVCGELKLRMMYDNPDAIRMYRWCGKEGMPVLMHIDYGIDTGRSYPRPDWWFGGGIEALGRALPACPETVFIGHAPGFWSHISADDGTFAEECYPRGPVQPGGKLPELLRVHDNLYCDISAESGRNALDRDHEFARNFLLEFQDRILFGRDCFDSGHRDLLETLGLPREVMEKIMGGNATRLVPP